METHQKPRLLVVFYGNPDYYASITRELNRLRDYFSIHLICANFREPAFDWPPDITVERLGWRHDFDQRGLRTRVLGVLDYLQFMRTLRGRIREIRPALVHAHDARAFVAAEWAITGNQPPIVYQVRDLNEPEACSRLSPQRWVEKRALRRGPRAALVIYSESDRADYYVRRSGDTRPPLVWPNYASLDLVPRPRDFGSLIERRFARREVLYTGVIGPEIAAAEALRAIASLGDGWHLTIFGAIYPDHLQELRRLADTLGIGDRVTHGGWIPLREMISRTMEAAVGLVLFKTSSLNYRAMGTSTNKLYEYAARGIPVVVPDTASFHRALGDEEWAAYAEIDNPDAIAREIGWLLADRDRYERMCRAARLAFEQRYNFERVMPSVLEKLMALVPPSDRP